MSFDLPVLPKGWDYVPLDQLAHKNSVTYGVVQPGTALSEGVSIVRVNNFKDGRIELADLMQIAPAIEAKYSRTRLQGGEVLLTLVGSVGQVAVASKALSGFNVARAVAVIHPVQDIEPEWIALCLRSPLSQHLLGSRANTTVQTTINLKDLRALPIPLPSGPERQRIAVVMGALDDRIALLRETNGTLEAIAQALFKSWFVDFDPVRAKAEGLEPGGMDAATAALFPDSFEESGLGLVPRGWRVGVLGNVAETARKQIQPNSMTVDTLYVGLEHIPRQSLGLDSWGTADRLESAKSCFEKGDILFGKLRPYFHKVVIAPFAGVCSTDILVCKSKLMSYYGFVAMHLFSAELVTYADRLSNGAKMPRVNWKDLSDYALTIPPVELVAAFSDAVQPMFDQITANVHQAQTLTQLRDTLLPRLISGQLRLPEAEVMVEEICA
ncbi:restriction endonuclease subunit S [Pseudomonas fragi]|uniref:restriction endonuclease subunit S n=1 Tax=Pseudomonas TaxID=286 RepID=UPI00193B96C9|nr:MULTISPECIES: restriction endonuclease subunit S [Pseudomonas]MBM1202383.1 restriction endonuclease subunit S [Pseudomonas fragi]MDY7572640.1 restriction endonuclease subunit S [Pseudomonas sp. CCC4.1]MEB0143226.1 restriction endonuclease subunit S [Pseudomonas sp. CCC4.1]